ncbi:MAG: ABC transporter substrate-binding protein, partial [Flavobacteriales bacterium]|nr:ABC transporter substrate-binding protein [Flavobacteriales bacterium]
MKKIIYLMIASSLVFMGCGGNEGKDNGANKVAQGGVKYGGVFKINETEDFRSLYPLNVTEVVAHRITNQVYQGLVKLNQEDLTVLPSLAEKWEINEDATSFTFHLRKGVKFHDNQCFPDGKGREFNAKDVKFALDKVCESFPENQMYWMFKDKVKGAAAYYQSTIDKKPLAGGVEGIKVIDDYTVQIDLDYSFAGFLKILSHSACWIYPKEAFDTYGIDMRINCVGTGPFRVK